MGSARYTRLCFEKRTYQNCSLLQYHHTHMHFPSLFHTHSPITFPLYF